MKLNTHDKRKSHMICGGPTKSNISAYANDKNHSSGCPTFGNAFINMKNQRPTIT